MHGCRWLSSFYSLRLTVAPVLVICPHSPHNPGVYYPVTNI
eukprot:COSAG06_NODE_36970_length_441_cov_0.444444_1_plen_40_part_10